MMPMETLDQYLIQRHGIFLRSKTLLPIFHTYISTTLNARGVPYQARRADMSVVNFKNANNNSGRSDTQISNIRNRSI
jgi:hypothetical protein